MSRSLRTVLWAVAGGLLLLGSTAAGVVAYAGDLLRTDQFYPIDFPEMSMLTGDWTALKLIPATLAAMGLLCGLTTLALIALPASVHVVRIFSATVISMSLLLVNGSAAQMINAGGFAEWQPYMNGVSRPPALPGETVAVDSHFDYSVLFPLSVRIWWDRFETFDAEIAAPPGEACVAIVRPSDLTIPVPAGWRVAERFEDRWVAWRRTTCPPAP